MSRCFSIFIVALAAVSCAEGVDSFRIQVVFPNSRALEWIETFEIWSLETSEGLCDRLMNEDLDPQSVTHYGMVSAQLAELPGPLQLVDIPTQQMTLFAQGLRRSRPLLRSCMPLNLRSTGDALIMIEMQPVCSDDCDIFTDEVTITKVEWKADREELKVQATSSEQPDAILTLVGFGEMTYKRDKYEFKIQPIEDPGGVTVTSSLGGSAEASTGN